MEFRARLDVPIRKLLCLCMFSVWQMGAVLYSGTALSINGRTPLPITPENLTAVIILGYVCSILFLVFFQRRSVFAGRVLSSLAAVCTALCFIAFPDKVLAALYCGSVFCCVALIGVTISVPVNLFTERSEMTDALISSSIGGLLIALLQNELFPVSYQVFRFFSLFASLCVLWFFISMPSRVWPEYVSRKRPQPAPKRRIAGVLSLVFLSCVLTLFGSSVAETVAHGVSLYYISSAVCAALLYLLWKRFSLSPLRAASALVCCAALGFVLALAASALPALRVPAVVLLGSGLAVCSFSSYFGLVLSKQYASRFISPAIILLALAAVLLHSFLLDALRAETVSLYIIYAVIALVTVLLYLLLEPVFSRALPDASADAEPEPLTSGPFARLSAQERRLAALILQGYTGVEIADALSITENTAKGYRKTLYTKLDIHSKRELCELASESGDAPFKLK